jgi:hypothetical protein
MERGNNKPPLKDIQKLVEAAGYQLISINAEHEEFGWAKLRFTGVISLKIAPAAFFPDNEGFPCFTKIPSCLTALPSLCHECTVQRHQQEKGSCQE